MNELIQNVARYRDFAEECLRLIERLPPDAHDPLMAMAEAWLDLATSELNATSASNHQHP